MPTVPMPVTTRFAPSPTGLLHLGHARSALVAWRRAREAGGRFLLRLEDIDPGRCRPEHAAAIEEDLAWLGLRWDGPVRVQSQHLAEYRAALDGLAARGLLYPCFCTRADILREVKGAASAPHGPDGVPLYPGTCRALPAGVRHANDPRASSSQAHRESSPSLAMRSTSRVSPLRLSRTPSASSHMRIRSPGAPATWNTRSTP